MSQNPDDVLRYLDKWEDTAKHCFEYFSKSSEASAAQHCNDKVFYSPIVNRLDELLGDIRIVRKGLGTDGQEPTD